MHGSFVLLKIDDMNTRNIKFSGTLLLALLMVTALEAQHRLDLTDEQQEELSTLRTEHYKEIEPLKNRMAELRARERTLLSEEEVDIQAVEKNIDEQTDVTNKLKKLQTRHQLNVKNILTDEQVMKMQQGRRFSHRDGSYGRGYGRGDRSARMHRGYPMNRNRSARAYPMHRPYGMKWDQDVPAQGDGRIYQEL